MEKIEFADIFIADQTKKVGVVLDADDNPIVGFVVVGRSSEQYIAAEKAARIRHIKMQWGGKNKIDFATDDGAVKLDEVNRACELAKLSNCVIDWFGFTKNGVDMPFDKSKLPDIFKARPSWADKVLQAIVDDADFLKDLPAD